MVNNLPNADKALGCNVDVDKRFLHSHFKLLPRES